MTRYWIDRVGAFLRMWSRGDDFLMVGRFNHREAWRIATVAANIRRNIRAGSLSIPSGKRWRLP